MDTLENIGARAKIASRLLAVAGTARKNEALTAMARALAAHSGRTWPPPRPPGCIPPCWIASP